MKMSFILKSLIAAGLCLLLFFLVLLFKQFNFKNSLLLLQILIPVMLIFIIWLMKSICFAIYEQSQSKIKGFKPAFWSFAFALILLIGGLMLRTTYPQYGSFFLMLGLVSSGITFFVFSKYLVKLIN